MHTSLREKPALRSGSASGVVDRSLLARWISQIHERFATLGSEPVQVTRLVNSLLFATEGRVFASLRVDANGLFLREWNETEGPRDCAGLNVTQAQSLVEQSIQRHR